MIPTMDKKSTPPLSGVFIAIGMCTGTAIGIALHNLALGAGMGLVVGAAVGAIASQWNK
jgi:hypothetical protein